MPDALPLRAELLLDQEAPEALGQDLVAALEGLGVRTARVRRAVDHRGAGDLPWLVLASLPLQAFLSGLGAEAVRDAYVSFKGVVRRGAGRTAAGDGAPRPLVLQDARSGLSIVLEPDLPAEAYEQLLGIDLAEFHVGPLHYDRQLGRWRSELDEAAG
ncbi:hypothetical protein [Streptomyces flavofungini]|uniref:Uncharacterized protein n=1 Tax=Streptomyces flavofungini TaxID=68200 RepID=A0ABS0X8Q9_9ACTN|nr:hypothetical protein [Streptomyces flavofungini]MBJ3809568.1 hypothetical protein [Streptomyces flavofungini]GHC55584.1 hypothetical protein GCM10010349_22350 [Streptomyces flavofungini]